MTSTYRISELAKRSGVPPSTLRFYDASGLLPADRSPSGYRVYQESALERLAFIGLGKRFGLGLEEIAELLASRESDTCAHVKHSLRERLRSRLADATNRHAELSELTLTLRSALDRLDTLEDRHGPCDAGCDVLRSDAPSRGNAPGAEEPGIRAEPDAWRRAPVACSLSASDVDGRAARWDAALAEAERRDIPEGATLTLPIERLSEVAELAAAEQACCPFFDFRLQLDGARFHLTVRTPESGQAMLAELLADRGVSASPSTSAGPAPSPAGKEESCSPHAPSCSS